MKNLLLALTIVLGFASLASAQSATPANRLGWDQPNASLSDAQSYTYKVYADGSSTGVVLSNVTCVGSVAVTCSAPFPAFTPGSHTLQLSATNLAGEGPKSAVFSFSFVVVPSAPASLRIE